jgi:catechol 2,3-dioxygenase-like lactoylglutathione lyase family enzyme
MVPQMAESLTLRRIAPIVTLGVLAIAASAWRSQPAAPLTPRFNHVMLTVSNLDSSVAFYTRAFDLEVTQRLSSLTVTRPDGSTAVREVKMAFLKFPGQEFVFELAERKVEDDGITPVFQHVGVDVTDIEAAAKRVEAAGGKGFTGIAVVQGDGVKAKTAFFKGPDGENVELMQILSGTF